MCTYIHAYIYTYIYTYKHTNIHICCGPMPLVRGYFASVTKDTEHKYMVHMYGYICTVPMIQRVSTHFTVYCSFVL